MSLPYSFAQQPSATPSTGTTQCSNGRDDDNDTKIDFGTGTTSDPGCSSLADNDEQNITPSPTPTPTATPEAVTLKINTKATINGKEVMINGIEVVVEQNDRESHYIDTEGSIRVNRGDSVTFDLEDTIDYAPESNPELKGYYVVTDTTKLSLQIPMTGETALTHTIPLRRIDRMINITVQTTAGKRLAALATLNTPDGSTFKKSEWWGSDITFMGSLTPADDGPYTVVITSEDEVKFNPITITGSLPGINKHIVQVPVACVKKPIQSVLFRFCGVKALSLANENPTLSGLTEAATIISKAGSTEGLQPLVCMVSVYDWAGRDAYANYKPYDILRVQSDPDIEQCQNPKRGMISLPVPFINDLSDTAGPYYKHAISTVWHESGHAVDNLLGYKATDTDWKYISELKPIQQTRYSFTDIHNRLVEDSRPETSRLWDRKQYPEILSDTYVTNYWKKNTSEHFAERFAIQNLADQPFRNLLQTLLQAVQPPLDPNKDWNKLGSEAFDMMRAKTY